MIEFIYKLKLLNIIICFCIVTSYGTANAHRPHDAITDLVISPDFARDGTAFIIVANRTMKSTRNHGDSWHVLSRGLDNVFDFSSLSISPEFDKDGLVLASSKGDGIYRSLDHGHSWDKINTGIDDKDIRIVAISPFFHNSSTMLAADAVGKLYRSKNGGQSWELILQNANPVVSIAFLPTVAGEQVLIGDSKGSLHLQNAAQWSQLTSHPEWGSINCMATSPDYQTDATYWVGTAKAGILKTGDGGKTFHRSDSGVSGSNITSLKIHQTPTQGIRLYATTWYEALFISEDGGLAWQKYDHSLTTDTQADAPDFLLPHFRGIAVNQSTVFLGGFDGLFISKDDARTWYQPETWPIGYISMLALSPALEQGRQSAILAYGGGAYLIPDAGSDSWVRQARSLTLAGQQGVRTDSGISDIAFSPSFATDHTIFAATEHELIKSVDSGATWKRVQINKPFSYRLRWKINHYLYKMGVSSAIRLKIAGFFPLIPGWSTYIAVSPDYSKDGIVYFGTQGLGQCLSKNMGDSCSVVLDTALKITTSMAISPRYADDGTLFIGIQGVGIYRTTDGGATFKKLDAGFPIEGSIKLAISPDYSGDQTVFAGTGSGLFVSRNGGNLWQLSGERDLPLNGNVLSVAVSPNFRNDQTLLAAVKGKGVFKSTDSGKTFRKVAKQLDESNEQLKQFVFPEAGSTGNMLLAISDENIFKSQDGGETWNPIRRPVRYEDIQDTIIYAGQWETLKGGEYSDSTAARSNTPGSSAKLRFEGSSLLLIAEKAPENGSVKVFLDGQFKDEISLKSNTRKPAETVLSLEMPQKGVHEIMIEVSETGGHAGWVNLDAFEILP